MEPFVRHRGRVALLDWSDVNTDLIIPARYLKRVERTGYGPLLFADKRYRKGGAPEPDTPEQHGPEDPDFPLNQPAARGTTILMVGRNFGCGSSREHAVWAVAQAGFRALIAPVPGEGFADIFEGNAYQNGLLPIELPPDAWESLARAVRDEPGVEATIDLQDQGITLHRAQGDPLRVAFAVPEDHRQRLLQGRDAIAETLQWDAAIREHERARPEWLSPRPV